MNLTKQRVFATTHRELSAIIHQKSLVVDDSDERKVMPLSNIVIILVVSRSDLHSTWGGLGKTG